MPRMLRDRGPNSLSHESNLWFGKAFVDRELNRSGCTFCPCGTRSRTKQGKLCADVDVQRLNVNTSPDAASDQIVPIRNVNAILIVNVLSFGWDLGSYHSRDVLQHFIHHSSMRLAPEGPFLQMLQPRQTQGCLNV